MDPARPSERLPSSGYHRAPAAGERAPKGIWRSGPEGKGTDARAGQSKRAALAGNRGAQGDGRVAPERVCGKQAVKGPVPG